MVEAYIQALTKGLSQIPECQVGVLAEQLYEAYQNNRTVFLLGNGGSAALASHFACDLAKGTIPRGAKRFRTIALTDSVPLLTAWANDTAYDNVFAEQLLGLASPGDYVFAISGSGNSPNVLRALETARLLGCKTMGLTGFYGGKMLSMLDYPLVVPLHHMQQVEDVHTVICHILYLRVRERIVNSRDNKRAVLLDRDGTINGNCCGGYVKSLSEFELIPEAVTALRKLYDAGFKLIVVSSQAGVAEGLFTMQVLDAITDYMKRQLQLYGVELAGVYYCTHAPADGCECRKPKPGLLLQAAHEHALELRHCFLIGDSKADVQAGKLAGCRTLLVGSPSLGRERPDFAAQNILQAAEMVLKHS